MLLELGLVAGFSSGLGFSTVEGFSLEFQDLSCIRGYLGVVLVTGQVVRELRG